MTAPPGGFGFPDLPRMWNFGELGDIWFQGADGFWVRLAIPTDWEAKELAGTPYFLGIVAGRPAWRGGTTIEILTGLGTRLGVALGQD